MQMKITLRGNVLVAQATGQDATDLVPVRGTRFAVKGLSGYAIQFALPESGPATEITLEQPDGVFSAKRKS